MLFISRSAKSLCVVAWLGLLALWPSLPAHAFGEEGHALTCRVAWRAMTPETKIWVQKILRSRRRSAFESACTWPDGPGRSHAAYAWLWPLHYVGVPLNASAPDRRQHCPERGCILSALPRFHQTLENPNASPGDRELALRMLVHLIADLHLPVHIAHSDGRGGTMTRVRIENFGASATEQGDDVLSAPSNVLSSMVWNEHMLWDSGYLVAWMGDDQKQEAFLAALSTEPNAQVMTASQVQKWANESFAISKRAELFATGPATPITQAQVAQATKLVLERIQKAGARIAATLNHLAKTNASNQNVTEKMKSMMTSPE